MLRGSGRPADAENAVVRWVRRAFPVTASRPDPAPAPAEPEPATAP
jgi:hypothetical protein